MAALPPLSNPQKAKLKALAKKSATILQRLHKLEQEYNKVVEETGLPTSNMKSLFMDMVYEADKTGYVEMFIKRDRIE